MTDKRHFFIDARSKGIRIINVQINTMATMSIVTTVKIVLTEEEVE